MNGGIGMRGVRTDLAMESAGNYVGDKSGIRVDNWEDGDISRTTVTIDTEEAACRLGKQKGTFVTICSDKLPKCGADVRKRVAGLLSDTLNSMLPESGEILVIGLGNRRVTADALGARVVESTLVTRHLRQNLPEDLKGRLRSVCAISPGVLGVTGMETAEMVRGIVEHVKPAAVIAIDALAAMETARICTTVQITDTGISPGSGVGNHRLGLTESTMGVPVIAIGVPMVVYAATIAKDALAILMHDLQMPSSDHMDAVDALTDRISEHSLGEMVVTPREVDELVGNLAEVLSLGINMALQPKLSGDEIPILMH
jgi:spore protease